MTINQSHDRVRMVVVADEEVLCGVLVEAGAGAGLRSSRLLVAFDSGRLAASTASLLRSDAAVGLVTELEDVDTIRLEVSAGVFVDGAPVETARCRF